MNGNVAALEWLLTNLGDAEAERQARRSDGKRGGEPSLAFTAVMYDGSAPSALRALNRLGIDVTGKVDGKISFAEKYVMFRQLSLGESRHGNGDAVRAGHAAARRVVQRDARLREGAPRGPRRPDVAEAPEEDGAAHLAALKAHSAVARCLIDAGASLTALDGRGQTPAQVAEARGAPAALCRC